MKFDFTTIMDRKGKDALAVDKIPYKDVTVQEGFSNIRHLGILSQERNISMQ